MKNLGIIGIVVILLFSFSIAHCETAKETKIETSAGAFIIEGKVVKGSNGIISGYLPEYNITVKKGDNKINFYADGTYFPRRINSSEKAWSNEEILVGIFMDFLAGAHTVAKLNYDEFDKKYSQALGKTIDAFFDKNPMMHKPESNLQGKSKKTYEECRSNLNKIKILLGDAPDFSSKLNDLYNESLTIRKKMGILLSFWES
ncbi:MAG: hypothetical protein NTY34_01065 [Candidatus Omnitrophica bacterium]|nr:hypothetical protein [Candidatus Omnitrophota bacterium]